MVHAHKPTPQKRFIPLYSVLTQLTFNRLLFDTVIWRCHCGGGRRAKGLSELLLRGNSTLHRAGIFKPLLWTQVDFNRAVFTL